MRHSQFDLLRFIYTINIQFIYTINVSINYEKPGLLLARLIKGGLKMKQTD